MPLSKSDLADALEKVFAASPASPADAAMQWAKAYAGYAGAAMTVAASLPITAPANFSLLLNGFQGGLAALTPVTAGNLIAQGITTFWQSMAWLGPLAAGTTSYAGNSALGPMLSLTFADLRNKTPEEKAGELADAFDLGARLVMVSDVPLIQPAPTIIGPIL